MVAVLPLTDSLKTALPQMLEEHTVIRAVLERLADAAGAEEKTKYARLAEEVRLHAETEEQVTYRTAILIGEYVRRWLGRTE
jgi:hypothetical protein